MKFQVYEIGAHYFSLERHFQHPQTYEAMTMSRLEKIFKENIQTEEPQEDEEKNALMPQGDNSNSEKKKGFKKKKEGKNTIWKVLLSGASEYGGQLVEEVIRASHVEGNTFITQLTPDSIALSKLFLIVDSSAILNSLLEQFHFADEIVKSCGSKGYITTHPPKDSVSKDPVYEDFIPFQPTHLHPETSLLEYESVLLPSIQPNQLIGIV